LPRQVCCKLWGKCWQCLHRQQRQAGELTVAAVAAS
jgi:hypothetical protein